MNLLNDLLGKQVIVMVSGVIQSLEGILIDIGLDVIVIKNRTQFLYIPTSHIKFLTKNLEPTPEQSDIPISFLPDKEEATVSLKTIVENSKEEFSEIYVNGVHSLHGYIQSIKADYLLFYSPIFDTVLVHMKHLKYLIPYPPEFVPYALKKEQLRTNLSAVSTEPDFIQQLKKMVGTFIVMDLADQPQKVGLLKKVQSPMFELITPDGESIFALIDHIQTVNSPRK